MQNGLEMVLKEEEEDQGMWGDVNTIRLYDINTGIRFSTIYDSVEEAVVDWSPGQPFDFVVRQVPAKTRKLSMEELLQALDPEGKLQEEGMETNGESLDEETLDAIFDDSGLTSLEDLANYNVKRTESAPREATVEGVAFAGLDTKGYGVIKRSDLLIDSINNDGSENQKCKSVLGRHK
jgi:hypothetical protein